MKIRYTGVSGQDMTHGSIYEVLAEYYNLVVVVDDAGDRNEIGEEDYEIIEDSPVDWDGKEFPPVGTTCEVSNCGNSWELCKILFMGSTLCVVSHDNVREQHYHLSSVKFRPVQSEEDNFIKEITRVVRKRTGYGLSEHAARAIYLEGYTK